VRNGDSYTTFGKKQTPQETHIYPLTGKFYKPECSAFIHPLHFFPTWDYKVVSLCQESSRCSAKGVRAMCVRKKGKIRDFGVKRVGVGKRGERGVLKLRGRKWRERPRNSGRVTFYKTAVLSQVPVLSKSVALFFSFSHYTLFGLVGSRIGRVSV